MLERPSSLSADDEQRPASRTKKRIHTIVMRFLVLATTGRFSLTAKRGLVLGLVNEHSIAAGPRGIRVHAISPGPPPIRADDGLEQFDEMLATAVNAPEHRLVDIDDVGGLVAVLHWNRPPNNMCCNGEMKKSGRFPRC
jgi:NAD(P)-dependent dehydrogenase (short-subunit alcohol dehydrogenase family)